MILIIKIKSWITIGLIFLFCVAAIPVFALGQEKSKKRLIVASTPWYSPKMLKKYYQPLMEHLGKQLGMTVTFRITKDYSELGDRILKKTVDIGMFSPNAYVQAKNKIPQLQYLATSIKKDSTGVLRTYYKGVILCKKSSGIKNLEDLKGKRFGFTDRQSASGYVYPSLLLRKNKIIPETYFANVFWLKKHDKIITALTKNAIDAGATWDGNLVKAQKKHGVIFHVLLSTRPIPLGAIAAGSHVPERDFHRIQQALATVTPNSEVIRKMKKIGFPFEGYRIKSDQYYDIVREAFLKSQ